MITVTGNAACSIAKRNAILAGVTKTVWNRAYLDALEVVAGTIKTLSVSRDNAIAAFANFGVKPEQVFAAISVAGPEEITLEHIPLLRGMFSAIKNGEETVETMFNPRKQASTHEKVADPLKDAPAHDPATGEIQEQATASAGGDEAPAIGPKVTSQEVAASDAGKPMGQAQMQQDGAEAGQPASASNGPKRAALLTKLRAKAKRGTNALRLALCGLPEAEGDMLTDADHEELGGIADDADKETAG